MKTLALFKREMKEGKIDRMEMISHSIVREGIKTRYNNTRVWTTREVGIVQSNAYTLKTEKDGKIVDSWNYYPLANLFRYELDIVTFIQEWRETSDEIVYKIYYK